MINYIFSEELQDVQTSQVFSDLAERLEIEEEIRQDECHADQQIQKETTFEVSVRLDGEVETQKIYKKGEHQCLLVYEVTISIPKEDSDVKNEIAIDYIQKALKHEGAVYKVSINDCSIQFKVHRHASDFYNKIKELFELRDEVIESLEPVLQRLDIKMCSIVFDVEAYWHKE